MRSQLPLKLRPPRKASSGSAVFRFPILDFSLLPSLAQLIGVPKEILDPDFDAFKLIMMLLTVDMPVIAFTGLIIILIMARPSAEL